MKQILLAFILMLLTPFISEAYSDSTGTPSIALYEIPESSLVGGFSIMSLFEEPESFTKNSWLLHLGSGFRSDVKDDESGLETFIPPVYFLLEKSVGGNIGVGIKGGFRMWKVPKLDYQYQYYLLSLRATYHFNVHPKVDPYVGASGVARMVRSGGELPEQTNNTDFDYGVFIGLRYYLKPRLGVFAEYGGDGLTHFHGGLVFKLK